MLHEKSQDGGDRDLGKKKKCYNFLTVQLIVTIFDRKVASVTPIIPKISQIQYFHESQDGGNLHLVNGKSAETVEPFNRFSPYLTGK